MIWNYFHETMRKQTGGNPRDGKPVRKQNTSSNCRMWESYPHLDFSVFYVVRNWIRLRHFSFSSFYFLLIRCYNTQIIKNTYFIPWPSLITTVHAIEAWIKGSIRATWVQFFMAGAKTQWSPIIIWQIWSNLTSLYVQVFKYVDFAFYTYLCRRWL